MNKFKEVRGSKSNTRFLRGFAQPAYIHASKLTIPEDITIQTLQSKVSKSLRLTSKMSMDLCNER